MFFKEGILGLRLTQLPWLFFLSSLPLIGIPQSFFYLYDIVLLLWYSLSLSYC